MREVILRHSRMPDHVMLMFRRYNVYYGHHLSVACVGILSQTKVLSRNTNVHTTFNGIH